jgi:hypothetical protein
MASADSSSWESSTEASRVLADISSCVMTRFPFFRLHLTLVAVFQLSVCLGNKCERASAVAPPFGVGKCGAVRNEGLTARLRRPIRG